MPAPLRVLAALVVLSVLGGAGGCSGTQDESATAPTATPDSAFATALQPGAPGEDNTVVTSVDEAAVMGEVTAADVTFVQHMVVHHAQAITMVDLVEDELGDPEVAAIADRIRAAQRPEVVTMAGWLVQEGLPVPVEAETAGVDLEEIGAEPMADPTGMDHEGHGATEKGMHLAQMPGMATPEQLAALEEAGGAEAEQLFLELMIAHHEGALTMTTEQAVHGRDVLVGELSSEMAVEQQAEIGRMQEMQQRLSTG